MIDGSTTPKPISTTPTASPITPADWGDNGKAFGAALGLGYAVQTSSKIYLPRAFFKCIFGKKPTLEDFSELYPEIARGFEYMLEYNEKE